MKLSIVLLHIVTCFAVGIGVGAVATLFYKFTHDGLGTLGIAVAICLLGARISTSLASEGN